jgi:hypothetical protein
MMKTIFHALIACALGVALGLLWDSEARAANVGDDIDLRAFSVCLLASEDDASYGDICFMKHAIETAALGVAEDIAKACVVLGETPYCSKRMVYIRQRWGVPSTLRFDEVNQ